MAVLVTGIFASKRESMGGSTESMLLAGRKMPAFVGIFTMTATWVGGGYIIGTAEAVFDSARGLIWAQAPWGYALSLILGGIFFAKKMRQYNFTTLLDLFERRYGEKTGGVLFIPALIGEIFWSAAILAALGITFAIIFQIDITLAIIISAAVAIGYTTIGGMWSVAYTDVIQLLFILIGLGVAVPYFIETAGGLSAAINGYEKKFSHGLSLMPPISSFFSSTTEFKNSAWVWFDYAFLLILGGIPWQVYFQRVLSAKDDNTAVKLSIYAGLGCLVMAIPAVLVGLAGANFNWADTSLGQSPEPSMVLPYVLIHMTPPIIAALGMGAVAAAVMSSVDSSVLSASSMFTWNIFRKLIRPQSTDKQLRQIAKIAIVLIGAIATAIALTVQSVYSLWYLCADLVYVLLFPQLVCALFLKKVNKIGALSAFFVGLFLRLGGGDATFGLPAFLPYPMQGAEGVEFPFRTFAMLCSLVSLIFISRLTWSKSQANALEETTAASRLQK